MIHKLKTKIDINDLRSYYKRVVEEFSHLHWTKENEIETTNDKWRDNNMVDKLTGWGIDTNLDDINSPSPPYNISTKKKSSSYRNTVLSFGVVKELQEIFPFAYRWAISVQEPGGYVNRHADNADNLTVWIPIYNPNKAGLIMYHNGEEINNHLDDDGSLYLVDTTIEHSTYNNDTTDRVLLSFRFFQEHLNEVLTK